MTVIKPYASALTDYKENGFCKIDSMIDRDTVNEFIKQIDLFLSEKKDALSGALKSRTVPWTIYSRAKASLTMFEPRSPLAPVTHRAFFDVVISYSY